MRAHRQSMIFMSALLWMVLAAPAPAAQEPSRDREPAAGRIELDAFRTMHAMKAALVIDVRSTDAYRAGHIPGAVHVPLDHLEARAEELRALVKGRMVVTYCSCPEEHASLVAVRILAENGIQNAAALVGGLEGWIARGGKVERE